MKRKEKFLTGKVLFIVLVLIALAGCNSQKYVVVSDIAVMNMRDGRVHHVKVDSTLQMYDQLRMTDSELKLKLVTKNKP